MREVRDRPQAGWAVDSSGAARSLEVDGKREGHFPPASFESWLSCTRCEPGLARLPLGRACLPQRVTFGLLRDKLRMPARPSMFQEMYEKYAGDVYQFAFWLSGNDADAKDITAETFVRAFTGASEPRLETVKSYLFTIARNLHRRQWHRSSRLEAFPESTPDPAIPPDDATFFRDDLARALAAVRELPEPDRTALLLRAESGLSYEEIATITGLSLSAAKVKVFRARARLAAQLRSNP